MLSRLRIGPKLLLAPGVVLVLLIVLSAGAYVGMVRQNQSMENMVQQRAARLKATADLVAGVNRAQTRIYQLLTWINGSFSGARLDQLVREIHAGQAALDRQFAQLEMATMADPAERRFVAQSQAAHARYVQAIAEVIELGMADQSIAANAMFKAERAFDVVAQRLEELARLEQSLSARAYRDTEAEFVRISVWMAAMVALSIVLSLLVTMAVRNALLREVREIGAAAVDLAEGNLTVRTREYGSDEIADTARALDTSIRNLNTTLKTVLASAQSIDSAARTVAQGSAELRRRGERQAGMVGEAAVGARELSARIAHSAGNLQLAQQLVRCAAGLASRGGGVLQRLALNMAAIRGSSGKVVEIVGVIDGLAARSNLLAMNTALQAAQAGAGGEAFVDVASEALALAQRSVAAAHEIKALIAASAVELDGGGGSLQEAGETMAEMVASVRQLGELIGQVDLASTLQAQGAQGAQQAIGELDQVGMQHLALVREAAAAAASLQRQAINLSAAVATFKLDGGAEAPRPSPAPGVVRLRLASVKT